MFTEDDFHEAVEFIIHDYPEKYEALFREMFAKQWAYIDMNAAERWSLEHYGDLEHTELLKTA